MLSKCWNNPSVYDMIMKLLITRGQITLIPQEATQEKSTQDSSSTVNDKQLIFLQDRRNRIVPRAPYSNVLQNSEL